MKIVIYLILVIFFSARLEAQTIKIGSLQYGSVNWELKLIKELELDKKNDFNLEIIELASKNAAAVA
ncbi:MAG: ABC transporter substrate-binding protein, partial [Alphaproteobacteria bacterium]|nr:ABC transporter substrate-binding protein [Alphaproteobacteria bacterium]